METGENGRNNNQNIPSNVYPQRPTPHFLKTLKITNEIYNVNSEEINNTSGPYQNNPLGEEPIDLTCSEKRIEENYFNNTYQEEIPFGYATSATNLEDLQLSNNNYNYLILNNNNPKRRGRKREYEQNIQDKEVPTLDVELLKNLDTSNNFQLTANKQTEVLKAAKSLFSKRTRTLYHWLYPNAPKAQLKAAVATSWETLGAQEKELYISQVLGRFGFPQTNLMVNPQLGGISGALTVPTPLDIEAENHEETSTAVSTLLMSEQGTDINWMHPHQNVIHLHYPPYVKLMSRKRGRLGRPQEAKIEKVLRTRLSLLSKCKKLTTSSEKTQSLAESCNSFKWALHINDDDKP